MEIIFGIIIIILLFWTAYNLEQQIKSINATDFRIGQINQTLIRIENYLEKLIKGKTK